MTYYDKRIFSKKNDICNFEQKYINDIFLIFYSCLLIYVSFASFDQQTYKIEPEQMQKKKQQQRLQLQQQHAAAQLTRQQHQQLRRRQRRLQ